MLNRLRPVMDLLSAYFQAAPSNPAVVAIPERRLAQTLFVGIPHLAARKGMEFGCVEGAVFGVEGHPSSVQRRTPAEGTTKRLA